MNISDIKININNGDVGGGACGLLEEIIVKELDSVQEPLNGSKVGHILQ